MEREFEEVEDFFREREQHQRAELAAERRHAAEIVAEQNRRAWRDKWLRYALDSAPWDAPKGVELNIHRTVEDTLKNLDPDQPEDLVEQLVNAAVESALIPWRHARERESALDAALASLPWGIQYGSEFADLKQRALYLASEALDGQPHSATEWELQDAARQAVQPVKAEYEHREACERVIGSVVLTGAGLEEVEAARETIRESLSRVPIRASQPRLEQAKQAVLAPILQKIGERRQQEQQQRAEDLRRVQAELAAEVHLGHVKTYLQEAFEFEGGYPELSQLAEPLLPLIRERLLDFLASNINANTDELRHLIEDWVDELVEE